MLKPEAIIFDFDGVLLESEFDGNRQLAELLTDLGHRTTLEEALKYYVGLSGKEFIAAIEGRIGVPLPPEFHERRMEQSIRALREGVRAVVGAVDFVRSLPPGLPRGGRLVQLDPLDQGPSRPSRPGRSVRRACL